MLVCRLNNCRSPTIGEKYERPLSLSSGLSSSFALSCGLLVIAPKRAHVVSLSAFTVRSGSALPSVHQKSPADVARDILGIEFQAIEHEPRRFHDIVADAVARHPCNPVFRHRKPILSASAPPASDLSSF